MATSSNDINNCLREWAPLTDLFNKLPARIQHGLFTQEVKITCIDILSEFIALGTNLGIVYWFNRTTQDLERLRCEKNNVPIVSLKVISTVDYMIACANIDGHISIFQIPKAHPDSLPECLKPKNKQVERYTVSELHKSPITALEWSKNGMKLFSGDKNGCIILTEIDFYMHICKSIEILNEAYEVVQLSYNQQKLLISTTYRSIICQKFDKWKVCQVGKKDRKVLGSFGGIIFQNGLKMTDTVLYCTRPGLRIWISDCEGNVQQTLLFKDLLLKECIEVPIINPIGKKLKTIKPQKEPSFGILLPFSDNLIVTYNNDIIYILDPQKMILMYSMSHFRSVLCVATHKDEIFVLEEDRSIVRISFTPESIQNTTSYSCMYNSFSPLRSSIKDLTNKIQSTSVISAMPPYMENALNEVSVHTDDSMIMRAEEAKELSVQIQRINSEVEKKFNDIGRQEFSNQILFKKKREKPTNLMSISTNSLCSNSSEEKDVMSYNKPTLMTLSTVGVLPDLRSPESIQHDIEYKEKILEDVLNLDKFKIPLERLNEHTNSNKNAEPSNCNYKKENNTTSVVNASHGYVSNSSYSDYKKEVPACRNIPDEWKLLDIQLNFTNKINENPPVCQNIPNEWKLSDIQLNLTTEESDSADSCLTDWEVL